MLCDASSVMYPGIIGCFVSRNIIHPHPGDPAGVDQAPTCVPVAIHGSALLIQSHLVAFSAASFADWMDIFLATPETPKRLRTLQSEHPAKPLQPTSTIEGSPASLPAFLHQFLALSTFPLIGFINTLFPEHRKFQHDQLFETSEVTIMSGRRLVVAMCWGNFSCFPRLTCSCQSEALWRWPVVNYGCVWGFSPALMKGTTYFEAWWYLLVLMAEAKLSAIALSTWSWRQR